MRKMRNKKTEGTPISRRRFLAGLGRAAALGSLFSIDGFDPLAAEELAGSDARPHAPDLKSLRGPGGPTWNAVRKQFLLREGLVYLNSGSLGPCPAHVVNEAVKAWYMLEENPAEQGFGSFIQKMEEARKKAADFLHCSPDEIAITRNTTDGMNTVAQGIHLGRGDRVLTTDQEHPGGTACWEYYARREGVGIDRIRLPKTPQSTEEIVNLFERGLTRDTRAISVSHVTYSTGLRLPIEEISLLARANDSLLVVDGAQAPGVLDVNVQRLKCDAYATSAHKWMLAPKGTGLLYIHRDARQRIDPLLLAHGPQAYTASTGTPNIPAILGLGAAIDFLNAIGKESIEPRALELRSLAVQSLRAIPGITLASVPEGPSASALLTFLLPEKIQPDGLAKVLREKYAIVVRVVSAPGGSGIRLSFHLFNTEADVQRLSEALKKELA